jgi:CDP-diacylglycerol--glycerol-3-phosphate 3-phosphatidyltransferase/cardiolipin synthase
LAVVFVAVPDAGVRVAVVAAAVLSDLLDGWWARRIGGSRLGVALDPVCDKIFVVSAFWVVLRSGALTPVEWLAVVIRDLVAAVSFLVTWLLKRPTTLPARAGGKAVTVVQMLTLVAFLAQSDLVRPLAWATGAIAIYAIADYSRVAWSR